MQISFNIENIDQLAFLGVNNTNFDFIAQFFPKLKLVQRGATIMAIGDDESIVMFQESFKKLLNYFESFQTIDTQVIEGIITGEMDKVISKTKNKNVIVFGNKGKLIQARTNNQAKLVKEIDKNDLMFAIGPAGTGKTYTAIALAVRALKNRGVDRIVLTRPAVEAGEQLGFLPGDMKEKLDPYLQPLYDALSDMLPQRKVTEMLSERTLEIAPLAYMRGRTLENAFVILDEAQNTSVNQLKMFLTRMGENSKFIVTGDITQIDLPKNKESGLVHASHILKQVKGISFVFFNKSDIVRHQLVKEIVERYEEH